MQTSGYSAELGRLADFTTNFSWEMPWLRRNFWPGGWQFTGTGRAYSGQPFTPQVSNVNLNLGDANRPDRIAKACWRSAIPTNGLILRRSRSFRPVHSVLGTPTATSSTARGSSRWEVFNALNHPNLDLPENNVNLITAGAISDSGNGRQMQFALRYRF